MKDWRGNEYESGEPLVYYPTRVLETKPDGTEVGTWEEKPVPKLCDWPTCDRQAVRHRCNAEGDAGRTHHHGGIHRLDGKGSMFCDEHGRKVLAENARVRLER